MPWSSSIIPQPGDEGALSTQLWRHNTLCADTWAAVSSPQLIVNNRKAKLKLFPWETNLLCVPLCVYLPSSTVRLSSSQYWTPGPVQRGPICIAEHQNYWLSLWVLLSDTQVSAHLVYITHGLRGRITWESVLSDLLFTRATPRPHNNYSTALYVASVHADDDWSFFRNEWIH